MKRKLKSSNAIDLDSISATKRSRQNPPIASQSISHGRVDPTYGQRSAIPGLDDNAYGGTESELAYEDDGGTTSDALAYLRSVRVEASSIPTILVAPNKAQKFTENEEEEGVEISIYNKCVGDSRGYYEDGAYTAAPTALLISSSSPIDNGDVEQYAQAAYYDTLLKRFNSLREQLKCTPPRHAVEKLDSNHPSHIASSTIDYKNWRWRLRNTNPIPAQLAAMDKGTVLKLLGIIGRQRFIRPENDAIKVREQKYVASWVWVLLAKLPARGELVSEEVGVVRELGKRAVRIGMESKGVDMRGLDNSYGGSEEEDCNQGREDEEEVLDIEIHINDVEFGESDDGFRDDSIIENGDNIGEHRSSDPEFSAEAPPVVSPVLSTPVSNHTRLPFSSSSQDKPTSDPTSSYIETNQETSLYSQDGQAEMELAAARERILARLAKQDDVDNGEESEHVSEDVSADVGEYGRVETDVVGEADGEIVETGEEEENHKIGFRATLDMIVTIAGEVYGQRDLLEFREVWE